ncbi:MAG: ATP-binding protein [Gemmatimonadota bacterium]
MRFSRYADLIPVLAFVVVTGIVFLFDRERSSRSARDLAQAESAAERRAGMLADALGNEVAARMGALSTAKSSFVAAEDSAALPTFVLSLDSVTTGMAGLSSVSVIYTRSEEVLTQQGSAFEREGALQDTAMRHPYLRALATRRPAATGVRDRRVFVFDPVLAATDSMDVIGVLVAELDPFTIYRTATTTAALDSVSGGAGNHALYGPDSVRLSSTQIVPADWQTVTRSVRVADTDWIVTLSYPPPDLRGYRAERLATWIAGLALALAVSVILHFLRRTIHTQKEEIARRQAAEEAARMAAAEARERAKQARDLAAQLEAAQRAAQRLSTSLDPDDVVELFLGGVAEILDADIASLYTFEEEGELLVGRKRMVFRDVEGITERLREEDIRQVRAPVALLPSLGEAVSTGEPYVVENANDAGSLLSSRAGGPDSAVASVTLPLLVAGHTVGVASWEVFSGPRRFPPAMIAFSQALAAPASAALRTAELFLSLETERRRSAREALRFGAVLDQMADGVIVVDAEGRLERSNESAEELLSRELAQAPVDEWPSRFDLVSIEGRPLGPGDFPLVRAMRGERVRRATFIVRPDWGTERHLSCSAGPIQTATGEPAGAAMVLRDVTDEHQYAEMLRHTNRELRRQAEVLEQVNQQLREATKAKDQFLAVMSHELRTPINAIMGYSDLLDLGVKGPLNDDQRGMLTRVRETSGHLLGLINEVLDLAKIGAGRMDLVAVDIEVGSVVERAAQQILPLASSKGLTLTVEEPAVERPVIVRADVTRLTQIIVNLMSNAVKFTAHGAVTVSYCETAVAVTIRVADSGPGIPQDQAERIFEEFYQVEGGLSRASGGTGLGLSIARRFARLMNGDISVESEVGHGSTFTLTLPAVDEHAPEQEERTPTTIVLLAHDARALRRVAEDLRLAVRVLGATDPSQLVVLARQERPQLVALDARSPEHGAWRALTSLQSDPATSGIPIVLFAHADELGETALDLGIMTVLSKPLAVEHAAQVVTTSLTGVEAPAAGLTVLIADDDPDVRRILGEALTAAGSDVRAAASGGEALDLARRIAPDVAVIDLLMPGVDGIEAIAVMRGENALKNVRVVALVSRELADEEMSRLSASIDSLGRGRRSRSRATAEILRQAVDAVGAGQAQPGAVA